MQENINNHQLLKGEALEQKWDEVEEYVYQRFQKDADVKVVLFLIGLRELGQAKKRFTKEEKQDLMNLAACKAMSLTGYFEVSHLDKDGWPVWKQNKALPKMGVQEQEDFIRAHIIYYFQSEKLIS